MARSISDRALIEARRHYRHCLLCEHRCGVDRRRGERGFCRASSQARVFRHRIEYGEELELVPSHLFYLSGCDLRCAFCIADRDAFDPSRGKLLTGSFLQAALDWGRSQGARTMQWVGGEPTIHIPAILEAMAQCDALPRVVWKSDFYGTPEAFDLLDGAVDAYVADFKFGNDRCARNIAGVERYLSIVTANLLRVVERGDLIVRHLLLPGHFDCCFRPIVHWVRSQLPTAKFSVRGGYLPQSRTRRWKELDQTVPARTLADALALATTLNVHVIS